MTKEFNCVLCGTCCSLKGYVKIKDDDDDKIAEFLKIPVSEFLAKFAKLSCSKKNLLLVEKDDGSCVFLDKDTKKCIIYPVRPKQCRTFPIEWTFPGWEQYCKGLAKNDTE